MSAIGRGPGLHEVTYDDTPLQEYADLILDTLERLGTIEFQVLFADRCTRGEVIGLFLALLELLRLRRLRAEQDTLHGSIYLFLLVDALAVDQADPDGQSPTAIPRAEQDPNV
jgi:chromatin segregation and condensation protein Rec8/ScpA/Scc1 (kleisin family)